VLSRHFDFRLALADLVHLYAAAVDDRRFDLTPI
jgi:hypothetical protein